MSRAMMLALFGISLVLLLIVEWRAVLPLLLVALGWAWVVDHPWTAAAIVAGLAVMIALVFRYVPAPETPKPIANRRSEAEREAIRARFKKQMAG